MKLSKKLSAMLAIFAISTVGLTGCGENPDQNQNSANPPANSTALKVGTAADYAPFAFQNENQVQGFDIDLINAIGKEIGKNVQIEDVKFQELISSVESKKIDVAINGITINDERKKSVEFSDPYFKSGLQILVKEDNTDINSQADLSGKRIAVQEGTTSETLANGIENAAVTKFATPDEAYKALQDGQADAVINDRPVNEYLIKENKLAGVKALPESLNEEEYGIAIAKDNADLQKQINDALKKLQDNGEFDKITEKWFGSQQTQQ